MEKTFLLIIFLFVYVFQAQAAGSRYLTPIIIENHIEITIEIIDVITACTPIANIGGAYHYGQTFNIYSRSLSNSVYNINFNGYVNSSLGTNDHAHFSTLNITNVKPNYVNINTQVNGEEVKNSNPIKCANLTIDDIGLIDARVVYWGTHKGIWLNGGSATGAFASTLPVELMEFNAKTNNENVEISWTTATEKNNDYFTIERSIDGVNFEEIGKVSGNGNSSKINNYKLTDFEPIKGVSYYRLKQTDYDGEYEYFDVKSVTIKKNHSFSNVYPNPALSNKTNLFIEKSNYLVTINVRDVFGQLIFTKNINARNIDITEEVELPKTGNIYFIEVIENKESNTYKVFNK